LPSKPLKNWNRQSCDQLWEWNSTASDNLEQKGNFWPKFSQTTDKSMKRYSLLIIKLFRCSIILFKDVWAISLGFFMVYGCKLMKWDRHDRGRTIELSKSRVIRCSEIVRKSARDFCRKSMTEIEMMFMRSDGNGTVTMKLIRWWFSFPVSINIQCNIALLFRQTITESSKDWGIEADKC
jgi:hypothetical protein